MVGEESESHIVVWKELEIAPSIGQIEDPANGVGLIGKNSIVYLNFCLENLDFRCLKAGMKPELVDAAFRRKSFRKKAAGMGSEDPGFIENLHALDKDDISEFFQVDNKT